MAPYGDVSTMPRCLDSIAPKQNSGMPVQRRYLGAKICIRHPGPASMRLDKGKTKPRPKPPKAQEICPGCAGQRHPTQPEPGQLLPYPEDPETDWVSGSSNSIWTTATSTQGRRTGVGHHVPPSTGTPMGVINGVEPGPWQQLNCGKLGYKVATAAKPGGSLTPRVPWGQHLPWPSPYHVPRDYAAFSLL